MKWNVIRVYTCGSKNPVIAAIDDYMANHASPQQIDWYFNRHWLGGAHVRLYVHCTEQDAAALASGLAWFLPTFNGGALSEMLGLRADTHNDEIEASYAKMERIADPELGELVAPFIRLARDDADVKVWGSAQMLQHARMFYSATRPILMSWLAAHPEAAEQEDIITRVLFATAWLGDQQTFRPSLSYGSHANGFFRKASRSGKNQLILESLYQASNAKLSAMFEEQRASQFGELASLEHMNAYINALSRLWMGVLDCVKGDAPPQALSHRIQENRVDEEWRSSGLKLGGLTIEESIDYIRKAASVCDGDPLLRSWQIVVNIVYALFNQLGCAPLKRYVLCWQVAKTISDHFEYDHEALSDQLVYAGDTRAIFPNPQHTLARMERHLAAGAAIGGL
jgi:hypothetical protein